MSKAATVRVAAIAACFAMTAGCAATTEEEADATEGAARIAKTVGAYTAEVHVASRDGGVYDILHALNGWSCSAYASAKYRETENDHAGRPVSIYHEGRGGYSFSTVYGRPSVTMPFTRDFQRWSPAIDVSFETSCSKTVEETCTRYDDQDRPYQTTCEDTKTVTLDWACTVTSFPERQGDAIERVCEPRPSSWGTTLFDWETLALRSMQSAKITTKIRLDELRETYDFDNCPSDTAGMDRFYLRVTQGLGGHVGEDDFLLGVKLDGFALPKVRSSTGLYSQAISFCRRSTGDRRLRVSLDGLEEDLVWDDVYTAAPEDRDVAMDPGTRREFRLIRDNARFVTPKESRVLVELFTDD